MMDFCKSSGQITSSTLVNTGKALLCGVQIRVAAADGIVIIYDGVTAAGTILYEAEVLNTAVSEVFDNFNVPVKAETGLYVDISGAGATCVVTYA